MSVTIAAVLRLFALADLAEAGDRGQYRPLSPGLGDWIAGLTNQVGANCCSDADGAAPEDVEWDMGADHYRVKVDGTWVDVPDIAVVRGPNYLGHAVVWLYKEPIDDGSDEGYVVDFPYVRCFLPGPTS